MPAELTLRLRVDPATGKRELVIDYASDADALPMEHEEEHRRLAAAVVDGGLQSGKVDVTREQDDVAAEVEGTAAAGEVGHGTRVPG
jgi:hypothetical protein